MRSLALACLLLLTADPADACDFSPFQTADVSLDPTDEIAPGVPVISEVELERGGDTDGADCGELAHIRLRPTAPDDKTLPGQLRFQVKLVGGEPPPGFVMPDEPISLSTDGTTYFVWADGGGHGAFRFVIELRAVDLGGNIGPPSEPIVFESSGSGCQVGGEGDPSGWIAVLLLVAALGFRRWISRDPR